MAFLEKGCGGLPLNSTDNGELVINAEYGIGRVKPPKQRSDEKARELAIKSAQQKRGLDFDTLSAYGSGKIQTQDQRNFELLKKGGYIK